MRAAEKEGSLRRPKLDVSPRLFIFHMRSWRPNDRLPARRGFGSRTAVHSREGSCGVSPNSLKLLSSSVFMIIKSTAKFALLRDTPFWGTARASCLLVLCKMNQLKVS